MLQLPILVMGIDYLKVLLHMGVNPGCYTVLISKKQYSNSIAKSNRPSTIHSKQRRKTLRAIKKGCGDEKKQQEGLAYDKGKFFKCFGVCKCVHCIVKYIIQTKIAFSRYLKKCQFLQFKHTYLHFSSNYHEI